MNFFVQIIFYLLKLGFLCGKISIYNHYFDAFSASGKRILIMKIKELIFFFLKRGAVLFTAISIPLLLILLVLDSEGSIDPIKFLLVAAFSYILSLGATIYRLESISNTVGRILHATCFILGFFGFLMFNGTDFIPSTISTAIFAVIYIAVCLITSLLKKKGSPLSLSLHNNASHKSVTEKETVKSKKKEPRKSRKEESTYTNRFS